MTSPTQLILQSTLKDLNNKHQYRHLPDIEHQGRYVKLNGRTLLNIASNDYLGLGSDQHLQAEFLDSISALPLSDRPRMSATSSRLLTGNDPQLDLLEDELQQWHHLASASIGNEKSALVINSGYHANIGILPALATLPIKTLILADKLVHASLIDGIKLAQSKRCTFKRYRHNDYAQLTSLIQRADDDIERIIVVTESVFSMDGDRADLRTLVGLKKTDARVELYVDEAHAVGVLGRHGLGLAEETQTLDEIDYLVGTFGKAFASMGAYIFCDSTIKEWLINQMRSFIFSTALPPINHCWTRFILSKMSSLNPLRQHLAKLSLTVGQAIHGSKYDTYHSPIIPFVLGENAKAVAKAEQLQAANFYALPIRPPTVPNNTARIRLVMNAKLTNDDCERLIAVL